MSEKFYKAVLQAVRAHAPTTFEVSDLPLSVPQSQYEAYTHVVHDVGGQPDGPLDRGLHDPDPWEIYTHCTAECLAWRGYWCSEERRRRENDLGETIYYGLPYYTRWLLACTHMLVEKGLITQDELSRKLEEIKARQEAQK